MLSKPTSPDGTSPAIWPVPVRRITGSAAGAELWQDLQDCVATESPLTLRVEGRAVAVVMRTPGHDRELAAGFLFTEGVIQSADGIFEISLCPSLSRRTAGAAPSCDLTSHSGTSGAGEDSGDSLDVLLADPAAFDPDKLTRHVFTSSSCGICSRTSLTTAIPADRVLTSGVQPLITARQLGILPEKLRAAQPAFSATGGLHACAWWDAATGEATPGFLFEDVGRHNALDKLIGHALLARQLPLSNGVLILSGRISFELVQKAHAAGIPCLAAVGAPSSLAIAYAEAAGMTLAGFVRESRLNLYSHPERVHPPPAFIST